MKGFVGMTRADGSIWNVRVLEAHGTQKVDVQVTRYDRKFKCWEVVPYRFDSLPWNVIKKVNELVKRFGKEGRKKD